ncbi:MAG: response regulator [Dehalococcoidales bacterium]|nr:response regulator [Dehalococcoidales bacterium]
MKTRESNVKKILIVEDELAIGELCRRVLTGEGFEVDITVNGRIAQDIIEKKQYDLYLLDIRTPEINGIELYQWLKEKHPQLANRVIFTSGSVVDKDIKIFLGQTGRPFLSKPFTSDELKAIVREI